MNRSDFLRITGLGALAFTTTRSFGLPSDYAGIPAGIRPYLQTPRPDSMWVSWFTDNAPTGLIEWGTAANQLVNSVATSLDVLGTNYNYHFGRITGLTPSTYYYYRVSNGTTVSDVFRFRTPPPDGTNTGNLKVLVLGDNQIIAENRYEKLIACCKAKVESTYGKPIEEVIDFILMPGDQVDTGTLEHYRHLHFKQCGLISPNIPIMTTVGNHETYGSPGISLFSRIFRYGDTRYANLPGPEGDIYYAYKMANIAFVHTSSEHTGATQKGWVRSIVDALKTDATTDMCISVCHRPYQAEQYVGDISGWFRSDIMPIFAETEKHLMNIGAHHHLYARGQTREWPIYHIISGGTAWDQYWGQSNENDFDDVQKTVAHWAWQIMDFDLAARTMDVTCFAEANVRLPEATRWNYNSRQIDRFHRKLGLPGPAKPAFTAAPAGTVTLPAEMVSGAFATTTAEAMNSTWFQVAADDSFTNLKIDKIRDEENLYGDTGAPLYEPVDIHANVDILRYAIPANGLPNGIYHARLRHRDTNAMWSAWSDVVQFTVTGSVYTAPLLTMAKKVYAPKEDFTVNFENGPGLASDWIGIYQKAQTPGSPASTAWEYVNGTRTKGATGITNGSIKFTDDLVAGEWYAAFLTNDGYTEIAPRVPFFVGPVPALVPSKTTYDEGDTVAIGFSNAPGAAKDWIAIYQVGQNPGSTTPSLKWSYAGGTSGTLNFAGLPKGYYYAVYMPNDGYLEISDRVRFSVGQLISTVTVDGTEIAAGGKFTVNFSSGPGIPKDYIGLFKEGETPGVDVLSGYLYFNGATSGSVTFDLPALPPGRYFVAMFTNDSYTEVSNRSFFAITPPEEDLKLEQFELANGKVHLRWKSKIGQVYAVQKSALLMSWSEVKRVTADTTDTEVFIDVDIAAERAAYYRVTIP
ncbi:MAG: putative phosphohydrolase [Akkermansiaceae bacterium]|nr:putative phosphohydrolase [Akkermansiaceae bacterium]